ncbi:FIST N-terminal domain-containing protein [Limnoraphis robusta Tam1]|uniref:FIST signal transduction protein n=1 Tax=Limnoraphis robusta TaxID=1118279 RepID=UPI002B2004B5|nr:FIST N-terminal domain-containing protein [Limnoraphis robusta]MEA5539793.1 FIST N-terminal domain-containing protein [Limnoraphis robusta Tam1]
MKLETFFWHPQNGWSVKKLPSLDSEHSLVFLFGASELINHSHPIDQLTKTYPHSHFIGCSTAGEIFDTCLLDGSLSVGVVQFEHTQLKSASYLLNPSNNISNQSYNAGQTLGKQLNHPDLQGLFILGDGLQVNGSELIRGLNSILNPRSKPSRKLTITGGLAGDNHQFKRTWVLAEGIPRSGAIAGVGFYGKQIQIGFGCQSGWTIFGPERRVTRSKHNILYELDGKPALELYKDYLGEQARDLPTTALFFPLAVHTPSTRKATVRTLVSLDEHTQSMCFSGNIPQGALTQLMRGNYERLVNGALAAALVSRHNIQRQFTPRNDEQGLKDFYADHNEPSLAIAISGSGRRLVLGERTEEELEVTLEELPAHTQQIGFYSYGEFAPYGVETICQLHNQTMTLTIIRENRDSPSLVIR